MHYWIELHFPRGEKGQTHRQAPPARDWEGPRALGVAWVDLAMRNILHHVEDHGEPSAPSRAFGGKMSHKGEK